MTTRMTRTRRRRSPFRAAAAPGWQRCADGLALARTRAVTRAPHALICWQVTLAVYVGQRLRAVGASADAAAMARHAAQLTKAQQAALQRAVAAASAQQ